jgi:hypothetical protein
MEGPLKFQIVSFDDSSDREIHADFKKEFLQLKLEDQARQFSDHVNSLKLQADKLEEDSQERQGLLFVLQFLEELVPRVQAGDIPLDETIIVKVMEESPIKQLISGLQIN